MTVAPSLFTLTDGSRPVSARVNIVLYGNSGVGKTALATALPWGTERWGDKAIYVAWDAGSESLLSVRPQDREHLVVVTPNAVPGSDPDSLVMNPYKTGMGIATADWRKLVPEARTLIWDGGTRFAEQILRATANTGATVSPAKKDRGEETRLVFGKRGEPGYMAQPITSDYGMAQNTVMQWAEFLRQQPLNLIVICVSDYYKPEGGSYDGDTVGGPATIGVKVIPKFMKDFDNVFRISIDGDTINVAEPGKPPQFQRVNKRYLWTEKSGIWDAKIRKPPSKENPLAKVELSEDCTKFWNLFDAAGIGMNTTPEE